MIGAISKRFFGSNIFSKVPITLITSLSNCFNWRLLFWFAHFSQSFPVLKWHLFKCRLPWEKYAIQCFFVCSLWVYSLHKFRDFLLKGLCLLTFPFFFCTCIPPVNDISFCNSNIFLGQGIYSYFFHVPCHNIWSRNRWSWYIYYFLVEIFNQFS